AADDCELTMQDLGARRSGRFVDKPGPGRWTYRLGLAANWLNDPFYGDVYSLLDGEAEVLFIDDGSTDLSYPLMLELHRSDPRFKVIQLARNFGHQLAITAGIDLASGDAVIV